MERIRGQVTTPVRIGAIAGLVIGLILGLIFAWGLWPVQWTDAGLPQLRNDLKQDFLVMSIQSYAVTGNAAEAQRRWGELAPENANILKKVNANPPSPMTAEQVSRYAAAVNATSLPAVGQPAAGATLPAAGTPAAATPVPAKPANSLNFVLILMCVLTLVIGGLLAYLFLFRNRRPSIANNRSPISNVGRVAIDTAAYAEGGQEPPIVQYLTTYNLGNDLYDDSFSIDSPTGEFLGECGVGISETIGVGDPKKVTAFEVWLFDKNDIQTVTKVLMSQHAFSDAAINQRLATKGEPVLAEPGKRIVLETATLQLEARLVNMAYGSGAMPSSSFFEQMTLELAVWPKKQPQA